MPQIVIYGAGGNGREIADVVMAARAAGADWELLGFLDDAPELQDATVMGLPVLGPGEWVSGHAQVQVVMGLGHPRYRRAASERIENLGAAWATVVHPRAVVLPSAEVGEGCVIFAGAVLSNNCCLGRIVQVSFNSVVHHDTRVGDLACIMAQVALGGDVRIGQGAFLGIGVCTRQGVSVGEWSIIGAGAAIINDIPAYCVAAGAPARPLRSYNTPEEMPPF